MVNTEYFVRGTEPQTFCPIHNAYESSAFRVVATGGDDHPRAVPRDVERAAGERRSDERRPDERQVTAETVQPPGVTGGVMPAPTAAPKSPAPQKKRGFWGRVFGR